MLESRHSPKRTQLLIFKKSTLPHRAVVSMSSGHLGCGDSSLVRPSLVLTSGQLHQTEILKVNFQV